MTPIKNAGQLPRNQKEWHVIPFTHAKLANVILTIQQAEQAGTTVYEMPSGEIWIPIQSPLSETQ